MTKKTEILLLATIVLILISSCSPAVQYRNFQHDQIIGQGEWDLFVESALTNNGVQGLVEANGCHELQVAGETEISEPIITRLCDHFPVAGALVQITVNNVVISRRTNAQGQFSIRSGSDLARLTSAGNVGIVEVNFHGKTAQAMLTFGALDEVAALTLLDEMLQPTPIILQQFVVDWEGTDAAVLALDRYGNVACQAFRVDWNDMMASGNVDMMSSIAQEYDSDWQETFCDTCAASCRMLLILPDLSSEVGSL